MILCLKVIFLVEYKFSGKQWKANYVCHIQISIGKIRLCSHWDPDCLNAQDSGVGLLCIPACFSNFSVVLVGQWCLCFSDWQGFSFKFICLLEVSQYPLPARNKLTRVGFPDICIINTSNQHSLEKVGRGKFYNILPGE
jgi:hypothetical protein